MKDRARRRKATASKKATTSTQLTLLRKNVSPGAFEPVHNLLEGSEGHALLAILQPKQARRRDSKLPGEGSIRDFTPPFTQEDRKLMVQRLPHGETLNKSLFLLRNFLLARFRMRNTLVLGSWWQCVL